MKHFFLAAAAVAALSACTVENNAADNGSDADMASPEAMGIDNDAATPSGAENASLSVENNSASENRAAPPPTPLVLPAMIPPQYRGRWGMVPLDCTGDPAAAKGLIAIDASTIKYYESRATLKEQRPAIATSFSGLFAYTGEGQQWTRVETLTRTGDTLKRANEEGSFTYKRCP